jgi:hypothetical protein
MMDRTASFEKRLTRFFVSRNREPAVRTNMRYFATFLSIPLLACIGGADVLEQPDTGVDVDVDSGVDEGTDGGDATGVCCPRGENPCATGNAFGGWMADEAACAAHVFEGLDGRWANEVDEHGCSYWRDVTSSGEEADVCCGCVPEDSYYELVLAPTGFTLNFDRCDAREGQTISFRASVVPTDGCDSPAPIVATVNEAEMRIDVQPYVWREHGRTCGPAGASFERDVLIGNLRRGSWTVHFPTDDGVGSFALEVYEPSLSACTFESPMPEGEMCFGDCDCMTGFRCVAVEGDAACHSVCAAPCELASGGERTLDCAQERECGSELLAGNDVGNVCRPRALDECGAERPCGEGMVCRTDGDFASYCDWAFALTNPRRHDCTEDSDCEPGLDCVQHEAGVRRCEVRCNTATMRCPLGHACSPFGICDWLKD